MDLIKIINDLRQERDKLQAIISSLEQLQGSSSPAVGNIQNSPGRRGRRSMDAAGRLEVSRRMKQYWEKRRAEAGPSANVRNHALSATDSFSA